MFRQNHHSQSLSYSASSASAVSSTLPAHPVDRHVHVQTQIDESARESAISTLSDDPFQFDDPPVSAPVFLLKRNSGYDHRGDLHHIRTHLRQIRIRNPAPELGNQIRKREDQF